MFDQTEMKTVIAVSIVCYDEDDDNDDDDDDFYQQTNARALYALFFGIVSDIKLNKNATKTAKQHLRIFREFWDEWKEPYLSPNLQQLENTVKNDRKILSF